MNTILYKIGSKIYINLTNKCSNNCDFCVRNGKTTYYDYPLWLRKEPSAEEVIAKLPAYFDSTEFVFCGFGEPLYALDNVIKIGKYLKDNGKKVRLNTNGQADMIAGEGVAKKLAGSVDTVSISLNASTKEKYQSICHSEFGEEAFDAILKFASECKAAGLKAVLSIVDCVEKAEIEGARRIAARLGVELRIREFVK